MGPAGPARRRIGCGPAGHLVLLGRSGALSRQDARGRRRPGDTIIEVGPGPGGLTRALLETGAQVIAIERDSRFVAALEELRAAFGERLIIVEADALKADERALAVRPVKVVSNLPYNISTELLVKWLIANHGDAPLWLQMTLMFQKEVADRILAA
ncbi:MAG: hypothetical protein HC861_01865, partial [Rhodospirillaceae bacterium]|nr:hypothetical protein [Rhodospirillaceae bacterium]